MRVVVISSLAGLLAVTVAGCGTGKAPERPDAGGDVMCDEGLDVQDETDPRYPDGFDYAAFATDILPLLDDSGCAAAGCHAAGDAHESASGQNGEYEVFEIWTDAALTDRATVKSCNLVKSFNQFIHQTDYATPANSPILVNATGAVSDHPVEFGQESDTYQTLRSYIEDAHSEKEPPLQFFDEQAYADSIQGLFDDAGCTAAGPCHGNGDGAGGRLVLLHSEPAPDSAEMAANFVAVSSRTNLRATGSSLIYERATTAHSGSGTMESGAADALLSWIQDAAEAKCNRRDGCPDTPVDPCVTADRFNADAFEADILPMLEGDLDYNNDDSQTGCARQPCHGDPAFDRPGSLYLGGTPEESLQSFSCFVNLDNPAYSPMLLCPLDSSKCPKDHGEVGGGEIFANTGDLNYQRLLSFIFGGANAPPYDFAFFAKKINPIYQTEFGGFTCADTGACHGVPNPGETPPNFSDFPLVSGADLQTLSYNFTQSAAFANFIDAGKSPLFLYPTDQIGDLLPGFVHPPGAVLAAGGEAAQDILTWVEGLRVDADGFNRNWLVAGEYLVGDINDEPAAIDEAAIEPKIFDDSGGIGENNGGEWDGLFSGAREVNLNDVFTRDTSVDRAAYAVAFVANYTGRTETNARINVTSPAPNDVKVYAGESSALGQGGDTATVQVDFPPFQGPDTVTRVVVKVFQPQGQAGGDFSFTAEFTDEDGEPLSEDDQFIFLLGPYGQL